MPDDSTTGSLTINLFDGTRKPIGAGTQVLLTVIDGNQKQIVRDYYPVPKKFDVPIYDNFGDNYTVLASAKGYKDAGFTPIKMAADAEHSVDLMLMPDDATFNFRDALWPTLKQGHPGFAAILTQGAANDAAAEARYTQLLEMQPGSLASFLNLATAMSAINLVDDNNQPAGTPLDYIKGVIWDKTFEEDRFFGWADPKLTHLLEIATQKKEFAPEFDPSIFHGTATRSWKQIQFGEANVQLTFHEKDPIQQIGGINCVKIEPDIDYYKDLLAHFLLEVAVNGLTHSLTDPKQVYVLRWIAGRHAGVADFDPPYVIA